MGIGSSQAQSVGGQLDPQILDLARVDTNTRTQGALKPASTDSAGVLIAAWLSFDAHDYVVTSPSVLGYQAERRFHAILRQPGTPLTDPPIPLQS